MTEGEVEGKEQDAKKARISGSREGREERKEGRNVEASVSLSLRSVKLPL